MNAKELHRNARESLDVIAIPNIVDNEVRYYQLEERVKKLADYILATVREDDDEPVTPEWVALNMLDSETKFADLSIKRCNYLDGDFWINDDQMEGNKTLFCWQDSPPTRGQLRKLLEALGVQ